MEDTDRARWKRARGIFDEVVDLEPAARTARLEVLCKGDGALRREVASLLEHDLPTDDAIGQVVAEAARDAVDEGTALGPGQALLHYDLAWKIGQGGMGEVWKATDHTLGREVAIKILPAGFARDTSRLARFAREAKLLAALNHANIAAVYSLHQDARIPFLAMEYVEGEDLSDRLARGAVSIGQLLPIARQIAEALEEAHEKGIVHRDLKPANVKLKPDGRVKVLDFGLAKAIGDEEASVVRLQASDRSGASDLSGPSSDASTRVGIIIGTAAYMPPEQARGLAVDKRADIWAFGVILFEMLSGRRPFAGATLTDVLAAVVTAEPDWSMLPVTTPRALVRLTRRCLEKDTRQRLRDIGDARFEIEQLIAEHADSGSGTTRPAFASAPARSRWREVAMFLLGGAAAGLALWFVLRPAPDAPAIQRFNITLPAGTRLEDVLEAGRQTLALSRDGATVMFVGRGPGTRRQIYRRRLDSLTVEAVPGTEGGDMPFLSPDGEWLGFAAEGKLKRVPIDGGQPTVICDAPEPRGASWGDDDTIVFAPEVTGGLARVAASGGTPTEVTREDSPRVAGHRWPVVLPGAQAALFNVETPTNQEEDRTIVIVRLDTGERRTLLRNASYPRYVAGYLLYGQAGTLFAAPFDLSRLELTGPPVAVLDDVRMDLAGTGRVFVDVSPSGSLVYVPGFPKPGERSLVWIDRRGRVEPVTADKRAFRSARLSPDGHSVAVTIQDSSNNLWVHDLRQASWNRLTFEGNVLTPAWTPDGQRVIYSANPAGPRRIFWVAVDGSGQPEELTPSTTLLLADLPSVAADGRMALVTVQDAGGDDIFTLALDGSRTFEPFVATTANEASPIFSPSGRFVAYTSTESGRREVYVRAFAPGGRKWTVSTGGGTTPRWRRDERELYYLEGARLMAVAVDTTPALSVGTPRMLFEESALAWSNADLTRFDVTADGQRFLTVKPESREEAPLQLVVVPRFDDEMKARLTRERRPSARTTSSGTSR